MNDEAPANAGAPEHETEKLLAQQDDVLSPLQRDWLQPPGTLRCAAQYWLWAMNRLACQLLFRLRVRGREHIPAAGPFILTPSHTSSLDPFVLAAALPYRLIRKTYWAGRADAVLANPARRGVNRITQVMPLEGGIRSLAAAAAVLRRGSNLVWFPEGKRSMTGELQPFKFGIGALLTHFPDLPAIPADIVGADQAVPPPGHTPRRLARVRVTFGPAFRPTLTTARYDDATCEKIAQELRDRVARLRDVPG